MSATSIALCAMAAALLAVGAALLAHLRREDRLGQRLLEVQGRSNALAELGGMPSIGGLLRPVAVLGAMVARSGILSVRTLSELQRTLHMAGLRGGAGLSLFIGAKLLLLAGSPVGAYALMARADWWPEFWVALAFGSGIIGVLAPDLIIRRRRKAYLLALDQGLPDALDMLVICSEAGLALEAAFERVGAEIGHAHPVIAIEMQTTVQEMRINADRRKALLGLGQRTGLESLRRLGSTLVQTMQFGTPLSQALRTLSAEMRQEMLIRFEGRAARLPVLLTLPMILFILPCVFLVVGGPAIVQVFKSF